MIESILMEAFKPPPPDTVESWNYNHGMKELRENQAKQLDAAIQRMFEHFLAAWPIGGQNETSD